MAGIITLLLGIVFTLFGLTATLSNFGMSLVSLPGFLYNPIVTKFALLFGGIVLLVDSFRVRGVHTWRIEYGGIVLGIIMAFIGAFPLLLDYDLLDWMPFSIKFTIPDIVLSILLVLFGLFLLAKAVKLMRSSAVWGH